MSNEIVTLIAKQANVVLTQQNKLLIEQNLANIFMVLKTHNVVEKQQ